MNKRDQIQWLTDESKRVLDRAIKEFDFTIAEAVGVIELVKLDVYHDAIVDDDDDETV